MELEAGSMISAMERCGSMSLTHCFIITWPHNWIMSHVEEGGCTPTDSGYQMRGCPTYPCYVVRWTHFIWIHDIICKILRYPSLLLLCGILCSCTQSWSEFLPNWRNMATITASTATSSIVRAALAHRPSVGVSSSHVLGKTISFLSASSSNQSRYCIFLNKKTWI